MDVRTMTTLNSRMMCCICGEETTCSADYVELQLTSDNVKGFQYLGAHGDHLSSVLADGFALEIPAQEEGSSQLHRGRFKCCICGDRTEGSADYVEMRLRSDVNEGIQYLGAHAEHFNAVSADGIDIQIHLP
jgi:hypothetical protein